MNKRQRMAEQILRHGLNIRALFCEQNANGDYSIGALALAKALHRLEARGNRLATDYCNGTIEIEALDKFEETATKRIKELLPKLPMSAFHFNRDPRGYALKVDLECNTGQPIAEYARENDIRLYRDWGGYLILAPEFDGRP